MSSIDELSEELQALYTKKGEVFELTGIAGVKAQADVDRLQSALVKERNDHKALKNQFAVLGDKKPEDLLAAIDRVSELEQLLDAPNDAKINQLAESRVKMKLAPLERTINELTNKLAESEAVIQASTAREKQRTVLEAVRDAATKSQGFLPSAIEDAVMLAERIFDVSEDGAVLTKDGVGITPGVSPQVWLTEIQSRRQHWWGTTQGGGASGGRADILAGNPFSHDGWNLTAQGKLMTADPAKAAQMAKSAGTTIGGQRPAKK
jgi:hypothetical protein